MVNPLPGVTWPGDRTPTVMASLRRSLSGDVYTFSIWWLLCMYVYIYMYMCICIYIYGISLSIIPMKYLIFLGMKRERDIYMLYDVGLQVGSWTIATDLCGMYGIHFEMESFLSFFLGKKPGISSVLSSWSIPKTPIFLLRFLGPGKTFGSTPLATFWIRQFLRAAWKLDQFGTETPLRPVRLGLPTAIQEGIAPDEPPQTHHDWGMVMDGCHSMVY